MAGDTATPHGLNLLAGRVLGGAYLRRRCRSSAELEQGGISDQQERNQKQTHR